MTEWVPPSETSDFVASLRRSAAELLLEPTAPAGGNLLDTMEALVDVAGLPGLHWLVEELGGSPTAIITRSLSFMLARPSSQSGPDSAHLVYRAVSKLSNPDVPTAVNYCTAIHHQVAQGMPWHPLNRPPCAELPPFTLTCLRGDDVVVGSALGMVGRLYDSHLLWRVFTERAREDLMRELRRIAQVEGGRFSVFLGSLSRLVDASDTTSGGTSRHGRRFPVE